MKAVSIAAIILSLIALTINAYNYGYRRGQQRAEETADLAWEIWYTNRTIATTEALQKGKQGFYVGAEATEQLLYDLGKIVSIWQQHPDSLHIR